MFELIANVLGHFIACRDSHIKVSWSEGRKFDLFSPSKGEGDDSISEDDQKVKGSGSMSAGCWSNMMHAAMDSMKVIIL